MTIDADFWRRFYVAIGLLSSINHDLSMAADASSLSGITAQIISAMSTVLGGDVNVSFKMPSNMINSTSPRTMSLSVMDVDSHVRLRSFKIKIIRQNFTVLLPCDIFDHPGSYAFSYKIQEGGPVGKLNTTLNLKWGRMEIESPQNHTTLTRFGSIWVYHDRSCLPKSRRYRDKVNLYYIQRSQKVLIAHRTVRKVKNGKQRGPRQRIRMGFSCDLFDTAQTYFFEYISGYHNRSLTTSLPVTVRWSKHSLYTPTTTIFPCSNSFVVSFNAPECHKTTDIIAVYEQNSGRYITQRPALPGHTAVFFPCTLFKDYIKGYCFRYVSKTAASDRIQASHCVSTLGPGKSIYDGWSSWSFWNLCSTSCGQGRQYRYRFCLSLTTSQDKSRSCVGRAVMSKPCVLRPCPESSNACACGCRLTDSEGMITSSPQLFKKPGRTQCTWRINVNGNKQVKLWFDALELDGDSIFIRDGNDSSADLLAKIKSDNYDTAVLSTGNSMYLHYYHNGKWINGTRRGFTASYKIKDLREMKVLAARRQTLGTAEISFLAIFIIGIIIMGGLLLIVFLKLRRQHNYSSSSGSSTTSESTIRSMAIPLPLEDETSSNETLKSKKERRKKSSKSKTKEELKPERPNEFLCEGNLLPRCSCAAVSEFDSLSNSFRDGAREMRNSDFYRTLERTVEECDCSQCMRQQDFHEHFGSPEKKHFGDWMTQKTFAEEKHNYRKSFPQYV